MSHKVKVGILTFHHTTNYGATLQAYALWTTIKRQGYDVELIDYRPYRAVKYYLRQIKPIQTSNGVLQANPHALAYLLRSWKTRKFLVSKTQLSKKKSYTRTGLKSFYRQYDIVVCGSDQIWCIDAPFRGFDPSFFLDFICNQTTRKISYAASFGNTGNLGKHRELIRQLVGQFSATAVRDSNSLRLIRDECNQQSTKVLDPTFLIEYNQVMSVPSLKEEYLLLYYDGKVKPEEENFIKLLAETRNLTIISIGKRIKFAQKNLIGVGPEEWLGYFSKASYIVTNAYHGTIFSLIFKKPFTVCLSENKSNKINDLIGYLGLESRALSDPDSTSIDMATPGIDYDLVYEKLEGEILRSKSYLLEALDSKETFDRKSDCAPMLYKDVGVEAT